MAYAWGEEGASPLSETTAYVSAGATGAAAVAATHALSFRRGGSGRIGIHTKSPPKESSGVSGIAAGNHSLPVNIGGWDSCSYQIHLVKLVCFTFACREFGGGREGTKLRCWRRFVEVSLRPGPTSWLCSLFQLRNFGQVTRCCWAPVSLQNWINNSCHK